MIERIIVVPTTNEEICHIFIKGYSKEDYDDFIEKMRMKCSEIMRNHGYEEPTGQAKITPAYNLPCDYVIHTVGPIVQGKLTKKHCELLESCYHSYLKIAVQNKIESIAFCCITTGVFGFPQKEAAEIAVRTVQNF